MAANPALIALINEKLADNLEGGILESELREVLAAIATEIAAVSVPAGGTTGQILAKASDTDNDTEWIDPPTGGGGPALTFHFGTIPNGTTPTEPEIEALEAQDIPAGGAKIIQFTNGTDEWLAFAYPSTEADPTTYYIGPLDNGDLGAGGTFAAPVTVGAYRVIVSNYQTQIPDPVTFS